MKILRSVLCFFLIYPLFSCATLAETYTDNWDNGVTLDFEIDDSLLQPLDIFDAYPKLPTESPSDEQLNTAKDLLGKAMEIVFDGTTLEFHEREIDGSFELYAYNDEWGLGDGILYGGSYLNCLKFDRVKQYMYMETYIDDQLSEFYSTPDNPYPAERGDFYVEHNYMTHEEADAKAQAYMSEMRGEDSPFDAELRDWYGITHEQFSDFLDWAAENNQFKEDGVPSYFAGDDWTEEYDAYYLLYSYTYKGYPICDNIRTVYTGTYDSAINPVAYSANTMIDRDGFVYALETMILECDYTPYEDTPALTLYEAIDVLKDYLGSIQGLNPIDINRVYVEYLPYYDASSCSSTGYKLTFEPIWSFVATMTTTTQSGTNESSNVYRVNAHTGQIMTNGYGVIE